MFYAQSENKYIVEGSAFELGGVQYPANWLNLASAEDKAAIGLVEVVATNLPGDSMFYWVSEQLNGATLTYVNTPKDLDSLKTQQIDTVNRAAYSLLFASDWMVVREAEGGTPMAEDWKAYRVAVRAAANAGRDAIEAATDIDALIAATQIEWPHDPNYVAPVEPAV